jgi:hypothetical protein
VRFFDSTGNCHNAQCKNHGEEVCYIDTVFLLLGVSASDQQEVCPPWKQQADDPDATVTFILKCGNKIEPHADTEQNKGSDSPAIVQVDCEGNTSPVTCVTITPAFWRRRNNVSGNQTQEHTSWQCDDTKSTDNFNAGDTSRGEGISPANRDSFCSALSSASATSSVCGDEDDAEKDEDSCNSEADAQEGQTRTAILATEENAKRQRNVSEGSVNDSDQDKSSDNEAKQDDGKDEDAKTIIKRDPDHSTHEKKIHNGPDDDQDHCTSLSGNYETEVYTAKCGASSATKQRKLLKTRRVSDTYVGYKRQPDSKVIPGEEPLSFGKEHLEYTDEDGKNATNGALTRTYRNVSAFSAATSGHKDVKHDENIREHDREHGECKSGVPNIPVSENTRMELRQTYSLRREEILPLTEEGASITNYCSRNLSESCSLPTPENVFVKTTRKIFSPVRRDSRGKASSVISYVVGETCGMDATEVVQATDQQVPATSPVVNVLRKQQNENTSAEISSNNQSKGQIGKNGKSPPSWLFTRNRSQSSSPALTRRRVAMSVNTSSSETISTPDPNSQPISQHMSDPMPELHAARTPSPKRNLESDFNRGPEVKTKPWKQTVANNKYVEKDGIAKPEKHHNFKNEADSQKEYSSQSNKTNTGDNPVQSSRPATPLSSFPPLPPSPNPNRRDLLKITTKETAPSIRMMIARYNQKLTEQESVGGRSPEIIGSGSASPVAWRSPVAERRVRAQTEKYQEEVERVLQQGGTKVAARLGGNQVQKSASEGIIRVRENSTLVKPERESNRGSTDSAISKQMPVLSNPRSILKSPSAGSIKSTPPVPANVNANKIVESVLPSEAVGATTKTWTSQANTSPSPSSPSSPELGLHHSSPPPSRLRALRLQRAKEEFLTRGPGGHSWTSDGGTTSTETPSASVSPEPFWGQDTPGESRKDIMRTGLRMTDTDSGNRSRLSQISVESESSCDGSIVIAGGSGKDTGNVSDEGMLLVKSASAGMINVDPNTYRKFYEQKGAVDQQPSTSDGQDGKTKAQACSRFGISSIASRFRRVKMRRSKDRDGGKMNTVSMLCRQSLLVDLHLSKEGATSEGSEVPGPSTSKSCPSSPVLQRSLSGEKAEPGVSSAPTSWILNPARKIFKPK